MERTHFQSPARLARHEVYTYVHALRPGIGFSDDPEEIDAAPMLEGVSALAARRDNDLFPGPLEPVR